MKFSKKALSNSCSLNKLKPSSPQAILHKSQVKLTLIFDKNLLILQTLYFWIEIIWKFEHFI